MQKGLVSILTPCYNTGHLVHRLLDSVLMQDYPLVEMFCIDDGSTDNTREVVESYIPKFKAKGYMLTYIYQENGGQSTAINNGLKHVNGEFLVWPDSDDFYVKSDIISRMVSKMNEGTYDIGRCRIQYVDETDLYFVSEGRKPISDSYNQFDSIVFGNDGIEYPPVGFILRMSSLDETIPKREIYTEKQAGQNWQLMLPLSYRRKMFFLNEIGASVLVRSDSHSRGQFTGYDKVIEKQDVYRRTILGTFERMPLMMEKEKCEYTNKVEAHYLHIKMQVAVCFGKAKEAVRYMNEEVKLTGNKYHLVNSLICKYCGNRPVVIVLRAIRKLMKLPL